MSTFPILGRLSYQRPIRDDFSFQLAAAAGAYIFHSSHTITSTQTYMDDFQPWNEGDVRKNVSRSHFTAATPGGEGSVGFVYGLTPSLALGLTGRVILISKIEDIRAPPP